ncbi:MAG: hypothetical protein EZS28_053712, partial [Streblomastix strix]
MVFAQRLEHSISIAIEPSISMLGLVKEDQSHHEINQSWIIGDGEMNIGHVIWRLEVKFKGNSNERGIGIMNGQILPYPPFSDIQDRIAWYRGLTGDINVRGNEFKGGEPWGDGDVVSIEVDMGKYQQNINE